MPWSFGASGPQPVRASRAREDSSRRRRGSGACEGAPAAARGRGECMKTSSVDVSTGRGGAARQGGVRRGRAGRGNPAAGRGRLRRQGAGGGPRRRVPHGGEHERRGSAAGAGSTWASRPKGHCAPEPAVSWPACSLPPAGSASTNDGSAPAAEAERDFQAAVMQCAGVGHVARRHQRAASAPAAPATARPARERRLRRAGGGRVWLRQACQAFYPCGPASASGAEPRKSWYP